MTEIESTKQAVMQSLLVDQINDHSLSGDTETCSSANSTSHCGPSHSPKESWMTHFIRGDVSFAEMNPLFFLIPYLSRHATKILVIVRTVQFSSIPLSKKIIIKLIFMQRRPPYNISFLTIHALSYITALWQAKILIIRTWQTIPDIHWFYIYRILARNVE